MYIFYIFFIHILYIFFFKFYLLSKSVPKTVAPKCVGGISKLPLPQKGS